MSLQRETDDARIRVSDVENCTAQLFTTVGDPGLSRGTGIHHQCVPGTLHDRLMSVSVQQNVRRRLPEAPEITVMGTDVLTSRRPGRRMHEQQFFSFPMQNAASRLGPEPLHQVPVNPRRRAGSLTETAEEDLFMVAVDGDETSIAQQCHDLVGETELADAVAQAYPFVHVSNELHSTQQSGRVAMHVRHYTDQQRSLPVSGLSYHGRQLLGAAT
jgi:hypothetical protein